MPAPARPSASRGLPTHLAYADESAYNDGRYRSIGLITVRSDDAPALVEELLTLLRDSSITEFKWENLRGARERFAAKKMLDFTVRNAHAKRLRLDCIVWDTEDSRHAIKGRDDLANLQRMYYHLLRAVLRNRWPDGSVWRLHPHQHTAINWTAVESFLDRASTDVEDVGLLEPGPFRLRLKQEFEIDRIAPCRSQDEPLVQLADLCAGLAVYSRQNYDRYQAWVAANGAQRSFFTPPPGSSTGLSRADNTRCEVLREFDEMCKAHRLGVSLKSHRGLRTPDPANPINFWWYTPQSDLDKAPTRPKAS